MKVLPVILGSFILLFSAEGYSITDKTQEKIDVVKRVYADFIQGGGEEEILRRFGTPDLRKVLRQLEEISGRHKGEQCAWQEANVIIPGQDYDVKVHQIRYSVLKNGHIRAQAKNIGQNFTVDFDVQCNSINCAVSDVYIPQSYKKRLTTFARKGIC